MNKKILFLIILFLPCASSCAPLKKNNKLNKPPVDHFVKVFKELEITRCLKKPKPKTKPCETKTFFSTGSGLLITTPENNKVVLTAGHVCTSADELSEETATYKLKWTETISLLDRNKKFHDGHVILYSLNKKNSADLCSLYAPTLDYLKTKQKILISNKPPTIGEDVYYIGAPLGIHHPPTSLIIKGIFSGNIDKASALASLGAAPGASGSVILLLDNKIYGVLFAVHNRFHIATIITTYEETKKFLHQTDKLLK